MNNEPGEEELRASLYIRRQAKRIAQSLRAAADELEREVDRDVTRAYDRENVFGQADYISAASRAVTQLGWKFANLNLGQLIEAAGDADRTRVEESK